MKNFYIFCPPDGRRTAPPATKGVYIYNGRKIVMK